MFNYRRTASFVFTVSSYSYVVLSERRPSLLREKFVKFGIVFRSSGKSQASKLKYLINKHELIDFESIMKHVPSSLWKEKSDFLSTYGFTIHDNTAKDIANEVMDSVLKRKEMPVVVEWNPGFGLITEQLLKRGLKNLVIYNTHPFQPFNKLLDKYKGKIQSFKPNLPNVSLDCDLQKYFEFIEFISAYKDTETVVIGMYNRIFYRRLMYYITNISYLCCKNVVFYVIITKKIFNCLTDLHDKNSNVIDFGCFNHLFQVTMLKKYARHYFLPLSLNENEDVFFIRLSIQSHILPQEELLLYINFLRIIGSRKNNHLIGEIEKWFPGSGPYLIAQGVTATNRTMEFSADELLTLFKVIQSLKGYDQAHLLMKNYDSNYFPDGELLWT